jgi:hypothetical protein
MIAFGRVHRLTAVCGALVLTAAAGAQERSPFRPFDRAAFETHVAQRGASQELLRQFAAECAEASPGAAADGLLRGLFPAFDAAVALAESGDPRAPAALAELLAGAPDQYVRAHTRWHLGRILLDGDDPERAAQVLGAFLREDRNTTPLDGEVLYLYSSAMALLPSPADAIAGFRVFLQSFPDAPERYRANATQQLAELQSETDSPLHEVADLMKSVERKIRKTDTGEETQRRQEEVTRQLTELLELLEEQQKQASANPDTSRPPETPAPRSAVAPGPVQAGALGRGSGGADRWGDARDRDRQAIESELQTKLPAHYRRMLEEYYEKLGAGER